MGIRAVVDKDHNNTRANTRLYIRIDRADYFIKWGIAKVSVMGYATYESGLKMKLQEDYYKTILGQTMDAAMQNFISKEDAQALIAENSTPLEAPYNDPQPLFNRTYNFRLPADLDISDTPSVYEHMYACIKTDSIYSEVEDVLEDPPLEIIETY
jgi:hypothetical protein